MNAIVEEKPMDSLWKVDDVAKYLEVPISTIRYWTSKGFIPHIKLPAAVRFQPEIIVEWTRAMGYRPLPQTTRAVPEHVS